MTPFAPFDQVLFDVAQMTRNIDGVDVGVEHIDTDLWVVQIGDFGFKCHIEPGDEPIPENWGLEPTTFPVFRFERVPDAPEGKTFERVKGIETTAEFPTMGYPFANMVTFLRTACDKLKATPKAELALATLVESLCRQATNCFQSFDPNAGIDFGFAEGLHRAAIDAYETAQEGIDDPALQKRIATARLSLDAALKDLECRIQAKPEKPPCA